MWVAILEKFCMALCWCWRGLAMVLHLPLSALTALNRNAMPDEFSATKIAPWTPLTPLWLLCEAPLALLSHGFYLAFKYFVKKAYPRSPKEAPNWIDSLSRAVNLGQWDELMFGSLIYGPRWNT